MIKRLLRRAFGYSPTAILWTRKARSAGIKLRRNGHYLDLEKGTKILRISSTHGIYTGHMIENFDYYWTSVVPLEEGGRSIVDMSGPRRHQLIGYGDTPFLFPSHTEPYETTREYLEFADLKPGQVVLDIGAYSGVTSIIFADIVGPSGHVYAFEADELNYNCAQENISAGQRRNITITNKAVWSHSNGLMFSNEGAIGSSAVSITGGGRGRERKVPSTTIEDLGLSTINFVKIDIEGGETELLRHSAKTLRKAGARLIVEPHRVKGKLNTEECCKILSEAGYQVRVRDKTPGSEALIEAA